MSLPNPQMPDRRIFDWLGIDTEGVPYYLHPLNLMWSKEGVEHDLEHYRQVADRLAAEPAYWARIIRDPSWRESLAGCLCLLASRRHDFFDDLCYRFRGGSFVSPQIAVTLGLLHRSLARTFLESALREEAVRKNPKQAISAHRVLSRLGVSLITEMSAEGWSGFERDDALLADEVVANHWDFWANRI